MEKQQVKYKYENETSEDHGMGNRYYVIVCGFHGHVNIHTL